MLVCEVDADDRFDGRPLLRLSDGHGFSRALRGCEGRELQTFRFSAIDGYATWTNWGQISEEIYHVDSFWELGQPEYVHLF